MQRGASLIEVLVAIVIVSVGVLSMAELLANSTRLGKTGEFRSVATLLAQDMADRIKANMNYVSGTTQDASAYDILPAAFPVLNGPPASASACANQTQCTYAELVAMDKAQWAQALYWALPNGTGYVKYDGAGTAVDLWVAWLDPSALSSGASEFVDLEDKNCPAAFQGNALRPRCMYFRVAL